MEDTDLIRLDNQLCFMLYACSRAMTKAYQPMLQELSLTYPQYLVLMVLWEWADEMPEEPSVKALGVRLRLDSGTLTPLLKRMDDLGLLSRIRDTKDERRVFIKPTAKGISLQHKAKAWVGDTFAAADIPAQTIVSLRSDLQELLTKLDQFDGA